MAFTDSELQQIYGDLSPSTTAPTPPTADETPDVPYKRVKQVANILPNTANSLLASGASVANALSPEDISGDLSGAKTAIPSFNVGQNKGALDTALNTVAPELAAWAVPYAGIGKIGEELKLGGVATEALAQGGANLLSSVKESPTEGVGQGALGAVSGALQAGLPRATRAIPLAIASATDAAATGNYIGGALNFAFNMLPGVHIPTLDLSKVTTPTTNLAKFDDINSLLGDATNAQPYSPSQLDSEDVFSGIKNSGIKTVDQLSPDEQLVRLQNTPAQPPEPNFTPSGLNLVDPDAPNSIPQVQQPDFLDSSPATNHIGFEQDRFSKDINNPVEADPNADVFSAVNRDPAFQLESPESRLRDLQAQSTLENPVENTPSGLNLLGDKIESPEVPSPPVEHPLPSSHNKQAESIESNFAEQVQQAAEQAPNKFGKKALISEVYPVFKKNTGSGMSLEDFKNAIAKEIPKGKLEVAPIDYYPSDKGGLQASELAQSELKVGNQSLHSIVTKAEDLSPVSAKPTSVPMIKMPDGTMMHVQPKMDGPHIISTVLTDGGDINLAGDKWNTEHRGPAGQMDYPSIMNQHMDGPNLSDVFDAEKSGFLLRDKNGNIKVTTDRKEALEVAKQAGQTTKTQGELHSQDLIEAPTTPEPKTVDEHIAKGNADDTADMAQAQSLQGRKAQLQKTLSDAKLQNDNLGTRIASSKLQDFLDENYPDEAQARIAAIEAKNGGNLELGSEGQASNGRSLSQAQADVATGDVTRGMMRGKLSGESGFVDRKTAIILGSAGLAGLVTYQQTKGDMGATIAAAIIVAGLGTVGTKAFEHLRDVKGPEVKPNVIKDPKTPIGKRLNQFMDDTVHTPAGMAVGGHAGVWASSMKGLEDVLGWRAMSDTFKDIKVKSGGFIQDILNVANKSLAEDGQAKPTSDFRDASLRYLRGQLNDPVEVQRLLNSGGMISSEGGAFYKLPKSEQAKYPEKWMQLDDQASTNTKGDDVTIWHVTNSVKNQLVKGEQDALARLANTPENQQFMKYVFTARDSFDTMMQVVHVASGPKEAARLIGTAGQYMTRAHSLITDPKFYPDEPTIQKAMDVLLHSKVNDFLSSVEAGNTPITYGSQTYRVTPAAADTFNNLYTPESLRAEVIQQIKEVKSYGAVKGMGGGDSSALDTPGLFTGRKEIDLVRQALIGTHADPIQAIQDTFNKLIPAAHSASAILDLSQVKEASGLPGRFNSDIEFNKAVNDLKQKLGSTSDIPTQRALQGKLNELSNYIPIGHDNPSMGIFQGSYVSRHINAQLEDALKPFGVLDGALGTALTGFNRLFKETHLVWNPVVQARNMVQSSILLVMGKAAHDVDAMTTAYNIAFRDNTTTLGRWAAKNGALSGNASKELNFGFDELLNGKSDNKIFGMLQNIRNFAFKTYSKPDDFTRTAVFIAAAKREAAKLGVPIDQMHLNQQVTDAARLFMNRRTMDYANVPTYVRAGRQIPFLSTSLTWSTEIARITKNMAVDAANGDLVSGASLAALSTAPFLAQSMAENSLSPVDRAAWKAGNNATQDYSRPRFKLPMSRNKDGSFNYYDITTLMPFGDYLGLGRSASQGDYKAILANNPIAGFDSSPALNLIASQVTGKDIHTQRDFRDAWDRTKNVLSQIAPPVTPGIGPDWTKLAPEELGGMLGQTNIKTGRTSTIQGALLRNTTGVDESQLNPDMAIRNVVKTAQSDITNERLYLRDALLSDGLSQEGKQRAVDRYVKAVHHITNDLHERVTSP